MTGVTDVKGLVHLSLTDPNEAARQLLSLNLPREWLWMALVLMSVLNAIVYSVTLHMSAPTDPAAVAMIPPIFQSPILFTFFLLGGLVITVLALTWVGQTLGGRGQMDDILVLISWMQVLRLLFQVGIAVISFISAPISALVVLVGSVWGLYILVGFINTAHGYDNWLKSIGVIILSGIAMGVGLTIIMTVIGGAIMGVG